jgi:uroporphyrinogen-III decarboxylase
MTPRERIEAALHSEMPDQIPVSIYWIMLPRGERERRLREAGLAIVERLPLFWEEKPHCELLSREYRENGVRTIRDTIRTPVGEVTAVRKVGLAYNSEMYTEHYVKKPEDYKTMEYIVLDTVYHADYDAYHVASERLGGDGYVLPHMGYSPLMLMLEYWLGLERFSMDLVDHPDPFFSLYETLCTKQRELYEIYSESPAEVVLYCGNVVGNVVGLERFEKYIVSCLDECAKQFHAAGKLLGTHLDANIRNLSPAVASSKIDMIEAFTPPPDCDMTVAEARRDWPDKILWCNFPSSVHLRDDETIRAATRQILQEAAPGDRFLIGLTEDIPEEHMWRSLEIILDVVRHEGCPPLRS